MYKCLKKYIPQWCHGMVHSFILPTAHASNSRCLTSSVPLPVSCHSLLPPGFRASLSASPPSATLHLILQIFIIFICWTSFAHKEIWYLPCSGPCWLNCSCDWLIKKLCLAGWLHDWSLDLPSVVFSVSSLVFSLRSFQPLPSSISPSFCCFFLHEIEISKTCSNWTKPLLNTRQVFIQ